MHGSKDDLDKRLLARCDSSVIVIVNRLSDDPGGSVSSNKI